jgi:hypothetical protein
LNHFVTSYACSNVRAIDFARQQQEKFEIWANHEKSRPRGRLSRRLVANYLEALPAELAGAAVDVPLDDEAALAAAEAASAAADAAPAAASADGAGAGAGAAAGAGAGAGAGSSFLPQAASAAAAIRVASKSDFFISIFLFLGQIERESFVVRHCRRKAALTEQPSRGCTGCST